MLANDPLHPRDCTGCPSCNQEYAAYLDESPRAAAARLAAETRLRAAADCGCSYSEGIAKMRQWQPPTDHGGWPDTSIDPSIEALGIPELIRRAVVPMREDVPPPPDSYEIAIQRRKENR